MTDTFATSTQIRNFIIGHFPLARKTDIAEATPLLETGAIDSLGVLDLVRFLEQNFGVQLSDDDLTPENFATIHSISNLIRQKRGVRES